MSYVAYFNIHMILIGNTAVSTTRSRHCRYCRQTIITCTVSARRHSDIMYRSVGHSCLSVDRFIVLSAVPTILYKVTPDWRARAMCNFIIYYLFMQCPQMSEHRRFLRKSRLTARESAGSLGFLRLLHLSARSREGARLRLGLR